MTNPIEISIATTSPAAVPDHDDPRNARYWERWHVERADSIASQAPDSNEMERIGELMGEVDHRAAAAGYHDIAEKWEIEQGKIEVDKTSDQTISDVLVKAQKEEQPQASARAAFEQLRALPGVENDREAKRLMRAGQVNRSFAALVPESWRQRFGMDTPEKKYQDAVERGHQRLVDYKADRLLFERRNAMTMLRGVDPNTPPHLLSSDQYRAAEAIIKTEQQLRQLRPLGADEYRSVVHQIASPVKAAMEKQVPAEQQSRAENIQKDAQIGSKTKHEIALEAARKQLSSTPTDYQTAAQKTMADRIVAQLQSRAETVTLSTRYQGTDVQRAEATHARAVEANMGLIEAVREAGIPVDTGRASIAIAKKVEVEPSVQAGLDRSMEVLQ